MVIKARLARITGSNQPSLHCATWEQIAAFQVEVRQWPKAGADTRRELWVLASSKKKKCYDVLNVLLYLPIYQLSDVLVVQNLPS